MTDELGPPAESPAEPVAPTAPIDVPAPPNETPTAAPDPAAAAADTAPVALAPRSGAARVWRAVDRGPQGKPWRVLTIVLLVLGCVLAPLGVTANWAKNLVQDQDAYLAAVQPLITDPAIVSAAESALVSGIDDAITNLNIADKVGDELQTLGLPPKLASLASTYLATFRDDVTKAITQMVDELLQSPKLATIWDNANADLHSKFVAIMQGQDPGKLHTLNVDLSSGVAEVKQKLVSSGVQWASQIPDIPVVINISGNANVQKISGYYDLLGTLGTWLPILAVVLLLLSIVIAPSRLGGLSKAAGWLAVSMVVLAVALVAGRQYLISKSPLQPDVTQAFTRQLTVDLQATMRFILISAAVVSLLAWLFGSSASAAGVRGQLRALTAKVQNSRLNLVMRVVAAVVAVLLVIVLVSLDNPGLLAALLLALFAGVAAIIAVSPRRRPAEIAPPPVAEGNGARHPVDVS